MIESIYKTIASNELSLWCKILSDGVVYTVVYANKDGERYSAKTTMWLKVRVDEVVGMPVMIGDVLYWMYESEKVSTRKFNEVVENICKYNYPIMREYKRKPIEDQSESCISYIYSLIK